MTPPCRILVATDFSPGASLAVERAAALARPANAELTLLHIVSQHKLVELARMLHEVIDDTRVRAEEAASAALQTLAATLRERHAVHPQVINTSGPVAASIVNVAEERAADLLVLGARGENPVRDFLLGSIAERVLRKSHRTTLVVRQPARHDYRQVLVPTDFSEHSRQALLLAASLAPRATISLLHVFDAPLEAKLEFAGVAASDIAAYRERGQRQAEAELQQFISTLPADLRARIVAEVTVGYAAGIIREKAVAIGADLVALGKHGRSPVEEWVLGSVTLHVLQSAPCDVLAAVGN